MQSVTKGYVYWIHGKVNFLNLIYFCFCLWYFLQKEYILVDFTLKWLFLSELVFHSKLLSHWSKILFNCVCVCTHWRQQQQQHQRCKLRLASYEQECKKKKKKRKIISNPGVHFTFRIKTLVLYINFCWFYFRGASGANRPSVAEDS